MSEKRPVVSVVITSERGVVLCERQPDDPPPYALPGGEWEDGETREECGVREVAEETGLTVRITGLIGERVHPKTQRRMHYLAAEPVDSELDVKNGDEDEHVSVGWYSLGEATERMVGLYEPVAEHLAARLS